jgi:hypothetical protein
MTIKSLYNSTYQFNDLLLNYMVALMVSQTTYTENILKCPTVMLSLRHHTHNREKCK